MLYSYLQSDNKFKYVPFTGLASYLKWEVRLSSKICLNMVSWSGLGSPLLAWTTLPLSHTFWLQRPLFCSRTEQTSTLELLDGKSGFRCHLPARASLSPTLMRQVAFPPNASSLRSLLITREALKAISHEHSHLHIWFLVPCLSFPLNREIYEDKKYVFILQSSIQELCAQRTNKWLTWKKGAYALYRNRCV